MEFDIAPTGCFLQLSETKLSFCVDVPVEFIPQNFFASKLFEFVEVRVNHMTVSAKSSDNDYFLTDYFTTRMNYDGLSLKTTGALEGYFGPENVDSSIVIADEKYQQERQQFCSDITRDGNQYKRYHIIMKLNIGLAMTAKPLPKEVLLKLIFYRNTPNKSLLQVGQTDVTPKLELINPILHASFIESQYYDSKLALRKIPKIRFPYIERTIRRELLLDGIDQFKIKLAEGNLNSIFIKARIHYFLRSFANCYGLWSDEIGYIQRRRIQILNNVLQKLFS